MLQAASAEGSCAAGAEGAPAQARELLRLLLVGQARLADSELEQAVCHVSGLLGHALSSDAACHLAAQIRHVTPHAQALGNHVVVLPPLLPTVMHLGCGPQCPCPCPGAGALEPLTACGQERTTDASRRLCQAAAASQHRGRLPEQALAHQKPHRPPGRAGPSRAWWPRQRRRLGASCGRLGGLPAGPPAPPRAQPPPQRATQGVRAARTTPAAQTQLRRSPHRRRLRWGRQRNAGPGPGRRRLFRRRRRLAQGVRRTLWRLPCRAWRSAQAAAGMSVGRGTARQRPVT